MSEAFVTDANLMGLFLIPNLSARILICDKLSSPDTYRQSSPSLDKLPTICNNSVDFPIPGSPPIRVIEPDTNPPPVTLSTSFKLVFNFA